MVSLHTSVFYKSVLVLGLCLMPLGLAGCTGGNSDVAKVSGTLTIDGQPVQGALVTFYPTKGRASAAYTDANGEYNLIYTVKQKGALIGEHKVTVTTAVSKGVDYSNGEDINDSEGVGPRREMLPKKFHNRLDTELTATVERGSNTIDFAVKTK